jgi:hypothetical protein
MREEERRGPCTRIRGIAFPTLASTSLATEQPRESQFFSESTGRGRGGRERREGVVVESIVAMEVWRRTSRQLGSKAQERLLWTCRSALSTCQCAGRRGRRWEGEVEDGIFGRVFCKMSTASQDVNAVGSYATDPDCPHCEIWRATTDLTHSCVDHCRVARREVDCEPLEAQWGGPCPL